MFKIFLIHISLQYYKSDRGFSNDGYSKDVNQSRAFADSSPHILFV